MIYKIPYTIYEFNGKILDNENYYLLKKSFTDNPYLEFPPTKTYYDEHKWEAKITIASFLICLILTPFGDSIEGTFLMLLLALSFITFLFSIIFQFSQYNSFQRTKRKKDKFFNNLKKDLIQSRNYEEFVQKQRNFLRTLN